MSASLIQNIYNEIDHEDDEVGGARLETLYEEADESGKDFIDNLMMSLCGWALPTLLAEAGESELLISHIAGEIFDDDEDDSEGLMDTYNAAADGLKRLADEVFIALCGYGLGTLIQRQATQPRSKGLGR